MPGYTIEKLLGRGGMGAVYRGVQMNLDRPVAIKILPPGVETEDPSFAERFKSEARLMARLNHPAVVSVYDFGTTLGGQLYFAMEYVDGSDVSQMLSAQGRLPPEHALAITAHVCDALSAAHEIGIVHRDIKPANVLINQKGQVKVADFGLAKVDDPGQHGLTKTGFAMGTPDFVAPEALTLGASVDSRADLYAVGVMLYQMLTGNIPRGAFKPVSVIIPSVDPRYDQIILKAMQNDREERQQTAAEIRSELDVILTTPLVRQQSTPVPTDALTMLVAQTPAQRSAAQQPAAPVSSSSRSTLASPQSPPSPQEKSKAPLFIGLAAAAAAAIAIAAFVMLGGKKDKQAAAVADTPASRSSAHLSPSTEPWQDMLGDPARLRHFGTSAITAEGLSFPGLGAVRFANPDPQRDGAVRMLTTSSSIQMRARMTNSNAYTLTVERGVRVELSRWDDAEKKNNVLREIPLKPVLRPGQDYELELRVVGPLLTAKFNGTVIAAVTETTYTEGAFSVGVVSKNAGPCIIKALQVLDLDAARPAAVAASASASSRFPPGQWVKVWTQAEDLPQGLRSKPGVRLSDGKLEVESSATYLGIPLLAGELKNCAVRATISSNSFNIRIRDTEQTKEFYLFNHHSVSIGYRGDQKEPYVPSRLASFSPVGFTEQKWEFAVVGNKLVSRRNGKIEAFVANDKLVSGLLHLANLGGIMRDVEVINLDGLPEAEALRILGVDEKGNDLRAAPAGATPTRP